MATVVVPIYALSDGLNINVHAKSVNADGDSVKNDIAVTGNILISSEEDSINVDLLIELMGPDGIQDAQELLLEYEVSENGNTRITYDVTFYNFASVKGMYYVTVTASSGNLTESVDFKWDPPGGGGGPPEY
jgi:hypothetical protein